MHYLSRQYLIDPAGPNFHYVWPAVIFFVLCAMIFTTYSYAVAESNNKRAPITRMVRRVQSLAWLVAVIGLALIGIRAGDAAIPGIDTRLALYLAALCFVALLAYVLWWLRVELPKRNAAYEALLLRRQYQPRSRRRGSR